MKSKFDKLFNIIMEQLTQAQKDLTDLYTMKRAKNLSFGPFKNQRMYFALPKHVAADLPIPLDIKDSLDEAGFYITDYRAGIAVKKTINGQKADLRQVKIGKILNRLNNPKLKKQFDERLAGNIKEVNKDLSICITHNPYDIAGMSTGRNWTSCMDLDYGAFRKTPLIEVQYGGMCAYLIDSNDKEIQHPYARLAIKRLIDRAGLKNFIFLQENIIYGDVAFAKEMKFEQNVKKILDTSNKITAGDVIEFQRDDGQWQAYSDAGLNKKFYIKDFHTLDDAIENGMQITTDDWDEISKHKDIPAWFIEKYYNFIKYDYVLAYSTYTQDELKKVIQCFYKVKTINIDFDSFYKSCLSIYNRYHKNK